MKTPVLLAFFYDRKRYNNKKIKPKNSNPIPSVRINGAKEMNTMEKDKTERINPKSIANNDTIKPLFLVIFFF